VFEDGSEEVHNDVENANADDKDVGESIPEVEIPK